MLFTTILHLAAFTAYTSGLSISARPDATHDVVRRQNNPTNGNTQKTTGINNQANGNNQNSIGNNNGNAQLAQGQENEEAEEENKPASLKTIAKAYKKVHHESKNSTNPNETSELVKILGQAVGSSSASGDPATVAKAIETAYETYKNSNGGNGGQTTQRSVNVGASNTGSSSSTSQNSQSNQNNGNGNNNFNGQNQNNNNNNGNGDNNFGNSQSDFNSNDSDNNNFNGN